MIKYTKEINGVPYVKYDYSDDDYGPSYFWRPEEKNGLPFVCDCGNTKFILFRPKDISYQLDATCTNCGATETVYDG